MDFYKLSGSGNDFIIVDNTDGALGYKDWSKIAQKLCQRRISIGADGLIVVMPSQTPKTDFKWLFYNADGSVADMCGNGGRCVALFACHKGIAGETMSFETGAGIIDAQIVADDIVKIRLTEAHSYKESIDIDVDGKMLSVSFVNTGVPHAVCFVDNLADYDVFNTGKAIRNHKNFAPAGTNVNFCSIIDGVVAVRTYERGVEDETLACGTGAVATALVSMRKGFVSSPVEVNVQSNEILKVYIEKDDQTNFEKIYLEGKVKIVYFGTTVDVGWQQNGCQ
ncbi:MAG: diaminopimelate epimerase [Deltaproteobacteria bacterium]